MKPILLEEVFSPGCRICNEFEMYWQTIAKDFPNVEFKRLDILQTEGQEAIQKYTIFSSPGIIINGELFSSGRFDAEELVKKLKEFS